MYLYGLVITALFSLLYIFEPPFIRFLELRFYDAVLRSNPIEKPAEDIAVVAVDEKSLKEFGQWPWPRYLVARLLEKIREQEPAAVGVDLLFAEEDRTSLNAVLRHIKETYGSLPDIKEIPPTGMSNDRLMAETLRSGPFVLGQKFLFDGETGTTGQCAFHPISVVLFGPVGAHSTDQPFYKATGAVCNLPMFDSAVTASGFINAAFDIDGLMRRIPLLIHYKNQGQSHAEYFPSLALATIMKHQNLRQVSVQMNASGKASAILLGKSAIPVDDAGNMLIHYREPGKSFPRVSAADLMAGRPTDVSVKGKIIFVGATAIGLGERRTTPLNPFLPGVEIHATAAQNILQSNFVKRPSWISGLEFFFILFAGLLSTVLFIRTNAIWSLVLWFLISAGLYLISYGAFHYERTIISPLVPLSTVAANFSLLILLKFWWSERALRKSESQYRSIFDNAIEGICRITPTGEIRTANRSLAHMMGFADPEDMLAATSHIHNVPFTDPDYPQHLLKLLSEEGIVRGLETEVRTENGNRIWVSMNARAARDDDNLPVYEASIEDVSDRKHAEEALRESQQRLTDIIDFLPDATLVIDKDSRIVSWNRATETMTGVRKEAMLGKGDHEYAVPFYGERRPILIDLALHPDNETEKRYTTIRRTGDTIFGEAYTPALPPGDIHLSATASVLRDSRGEVMGAIECIRNNTERKRLEERLARAEKMEALGTMAGGVAHDLNNVLGVLVGYAEMMMLDMPEDDPLRPYAANIHQSGKRGAAIIQDLLTLARRGVSVSEVVSFSRLLSQYCKSPEFLKIKSDHPDITIRMDTAEDLMNIKGSPVHLSKTLTNLVANAAEAIHGSGEIVITIENGYLEMPVHGYDEVKEGDYVVLSVSDTGQGISASDREKIFEPFYTKKVMGKSGTGLGLAIVWGTVKDHDGYIDVKSEEGAGSVFTLYFPATREGLSKAKPHTSLDHFMGGGETILVVDDIEGQRQLAASMLTKLNYKVATVSGGEEALSYLKLRKADLLLLDMIMEPGMDGLDTYKRVLEINPSQKAVIISGYTETEQVRKVQELGAGSFVKKPYTLEKLGRAVQQELLKP